MNVDTAVTLLAVANRVYGARMGFNSGEDLQETAMVWAAVLGDVSDEQARDAFRLHLRNSPHPPTPADILALVETLPRIEFCPRCHTEVTPTTSALQDDEATRLCIACDLEVHGGPALKEER